MSGLLGEKKVVSRNIALALGIICVVAAAGLVGVYMNNSSTISTLNSQLTSLQNQVTKLQGQLASNKTLIDSLNSQIASLQNQLGIVHSLPALNLTLIGASGQQKVLNSSFIATLTALTAKGGTRSSGGTLAYYGNYTGIPILTLLNLVGGVNSGNTVKITASDNYVTTLTYAQVNGQGIAAYYSDGTQATLTQPLTMIVAYYLDGAPLVSGVGPLRIAVVGSEGFYTSGNIWAKMVVKIQIN